MAKMANFIDTYNSNRNKNAIIKKYVYPGEVPKFTPDLFFEEKLAQFKAQNTNELSEIERFELFKKSVAALPPYAGFIRHFGTNAVIEAIQVEYMLNNGDIDLERLVTTLEKQKVKKKSMRNK